MDFTLKTYRSLLSALEQSGYAFRTFEEFLSVPAGGKVVVLRHDIDKRPENALRMAQMEHASGIKASYYIRVVKGTWNEEIIERIVALGHEMSYHYEDLTIAKGNYEKAFEHFKVHLAEIRRFACTEVRSAGGITGNCGRNIIIEKRGLSENRILMWIIRKYSISQIRGGHGIRQGRV